MGLLSFSQKFDAYSSVSYNDASRAHINIARALNQIIDIRFTDLHVVNYIHTADE